MSLLWRLTAGFNSAIIPLVRSRSGQRLLGSWMAVVTYTGRRSGRTIKVPVGYRRRGPDEIGIIVALPDQKRWWRNFTGHGGPVNVRIDGADRPGHAVAHRDKEGGVTVAVHLS